MIFSVVSMFVLCFIPGGGGGVALELRGGNGRLFRAGGALEWSDSDGF